MFTAWVETLGFQKPHRPHMSKPCLFISLLFRAHEWPSLSTVTVALEYKLSLKIENC